MQHIHGNSPYMFKYWDVAVVHLLLQKSSMLSLSLSHTHTHTHTHALIGTSVCKTLSHSLSLCVCLCGNLTTSQKNYSFAKMMWMFEN